uniref:Major facilitator superfamily (MFS) profile domain-containing protein n=1 Tax=Clastoptera arizonana TaxID=38151 RepID=A0A1B6DVG7_9HEMI
MDQDDKILCSSSNASPNISPNHRLESQGWTWILSLCGISTTLGASVAVGYNIGVVNTPAHIIQNWCNESFLISYGMNLNEAQMDILWSTIVSIFLIGGMLGSLAGSWIADRFGRKGGIKISYFLSILSGLMFLACKPLSSIILLFMARFIIGLASGLIMAVIPMYLVEIAPTALRGAMGVLCPLGVTFGVLLGQFMGLKWLLGKETTWHYLLGLYLCLTIPCSVVLPLLPESPKYLSAVIGNNHKAAKELARLRGLTVEEVSHELEQSRPITEVDTWNLSKLLRSKHLYLPLALVCSLQAGQQFSGINAVCYYSMKIFESAGLSVEGSQYASLGAGVVNFGVAALMIPIVNNCKRRILLLISCSSTVITLLLITVSITFIDTASWVPYFSIASVLIYVFVYGLGLGPIPYFIGSELFDVGPRVSGMALGSVANWTGNFVIGMTFPTMQRIIGQYSFIFFATNTAFLTIFLKYYLPETFVKVNKNVELGKYETVPIKNTNDDL